MMIKHLASLTAAAWPLLLFLGASPGLARAETERVTEAAAEKEARPTRLEVLRGLPATTDHELATFVPADEPAQALRYFLYRPPGPAPQAGGRLPLVVVLHHAGAERRLTDMLASNPESIGRWLEPETQRAHPCFVVAPWSGGRHWENGDWKTVTPLTEKPSDNARLVLALIDKLTLELPLDPARIYLAGQSMGGFGVWDLLSRRPGFFAAAIPVCGGGDPAQAGRLKGTPIWAFHGDADRTIPVERTRAMATALEAAGHRAFHYREYTGAGHDECSERAFTEPGLVDWLFAQKR